MIHNNICLCVLSFEDCAYVMFPVETSDISTLKSVVTAVNIRGCPDNVGAKLGASPGIFCGIFWGIFLRVIVATAVPETHQLHVSGRMMQQ